MIHKILVALDYYENNESVFDTAVSLAKSTGADLMLSHVLAEKEPGFPIIPSYTYYPVLDDYDYSLYRKKLEEYKQQGISFLQEKAEEAKMAGVNTE
ncbi:universal stress protein, partial [Pleurocapsales cyanobacterium LEGE 10410]|nr:universal stress protein [Pleurocapsales cyanobacterium LEGE 10410]